jgi:hypothetical protein
MRSAVEARACHRYEYCHLPTRGQVATFPIDHVAPRSQGGATALDNLALSCPHCNGHKWMHADGIDPISGQTQPLFNPRGQFWDEHFEWSSASSGVLQGKTTSGRATIARLQMNHATMIDLRQLLAALGLFPEVSGAPFAASNTAAGS